MSRCESIRANTASAITELALFSIVVYLHDVYEIVDVVQVIYHSVHVFVIVLCCILYVLFLFCMYQ